VPVVHTTGTSIELALLSLTAGLGDAILVVPSRTRGLHRNNSFITRRLSSSFLSRLLASRRSTLILRSGSLGLSRRLASGYRLVVALSRSLFGSRSLGCSSRLSSGRSSLALGGSGLLVLVGQE
jgi:hypothetical protein